MVKICIRRITYDAGIYKNTVHVLLRAPIAHTLR